VEGPHGLRVGAGAYEQVTWLLVDEESDPRAVRADFAASAAHASVPPHPMDGLGPSAPDYEFQLARSHDMSRAIAAALVVGGVVGFCAGLLASKWIL
jgi:hypothetical protein